MLDIAGHYAFNDPEVKAETAVLYENLNRNHIDGRRFVVEHIKHPIRQHIDAFNLRGLTGKVKEVL